MVTVPVVQLLVVVTIVQVPTTRPAQVAVVVTPWMRMVTRIRTTLPVTRPDTRVDIPVDRVDRTMVDTIKNRTMSMHRDRLQVPVRVRARAPVTAIPAVAQ